MLGTGKHWQQTINGITKIKTGRIGEELQTFGNQLQTLAKHCGTKTNIGEELQTLWSSGETLGKLWGNFGSNWVLGTGYWQETIKGITKVNIVVELQTLTSGETLGSTTNIGEHWGALQTLGARSLFLFKVHTAISVRLSLSLSRFPKDVQC